MTPLSLFVNPAVNRLVYTKNPVSGRNETLVNTSMLKGAVSGVMTKIADKADKGVLESLSTYTEEVATSVADKADKSAVEEVSAYAEGLLPKDVYWTMVDAYVGLACKVADPDVLEGAAKMAFAANPVKYATSNPDDDRCFIVSDDNYQPGNPIFDAVHAAGSTVELPPLLLLKSTSTILYNTEYAVGENPLVWKTDVPNLTFGDTAFGSIDVPSWDVELPNLTSGQYMFSETTLTSWTIDLPNLIDGTWMFYSCSGLTSFAGTLPNLLSGDGMFESCQLDIESLRCIAETINDVNGVSVGTHAITIGLSTEAFNHPDKQKYKNILNTKGWTVTF